ncbi:MAG: 2-oxoacid:acceptor oxidoreductase family protein [Nitrospira sp.]
MIKKRLNIRMSGLGGQGAVTAAHVMAMAANKDGKFSISNPFFGAEKRMAPAESYCRIGIERIYDRGELVFQTSLKYSTLRSLRWAKAIRCLSIPA